MADELQFYGWQRSGVYDLSSGTKEGGRLTADLQLTLSERDQSSNSVSQDVPFLIAGPRDVSGLMSSAVRRAYPPSGSTRAEITKCVYVELAAPDLPWRYTPELANADTLRPWLVLIVGTADEIQLSAAKMVTCSDAVAVAHPLAQSARWAHVQEEGGRVVARILSPRPLLAETDYIAAVVPAFDENGVPRWTTSSFTAPCYHHHRFRTGEAGDFESLAGKLAPGIADPSVGRAPMNYPRVPAAEPLSIRGAIAPLFGTDTTISSDVAADVSVLRTPLTDPKNRPIIGLPIYGSEWPGPLGSAWRDEANGDPRHRGVSGVGMKAGVDLQEALMDAAATQVGALGEASQRVRHLALGLGAARSLWTRRLPSDPAHRLMIYGPSMRRMMTADGPVLDQITGGDRPLARSLFSSAARRTLRMGPARTALAQPKAALPDKVIATANTCPTPPPRIPKGLPHVDQIPGMLGLPAFEHVLFKGAIGVEGGGTRTDETRDFEVLLNTPYEMPPCQPVDVPALELVLSAAIDPTVPDPIVKVRVLEGITGLTEPVLAPVEVCIGLDFPVWPYLRDHAPDWLLPGVDGLAEHSVSAFQSNPTFVDAFLLGFNKQLISELRWRNIPLSTGCTPARMFWAPIDYATGKRARDIHGVSTWTAPSHLGDANHQDGVVGGSDLILVFRTALFRRYPKTLVYLVPPAEQNGQPDWNADPGSDRVLPVFHGSIGEDIVFFRFDISPADARARWLVLEEPPSGVTFRSDVPVAQTDGASFAIATIDQPLRVLIRGDSLIPQS